MPCLQNFISDKHLKWKSVFPNLHVSLVNSLIKIIITQFVVVPVEKLTQLADFLYVLREE